MDRILAIMPMIVMVCVTGFVLIMLFTPYIEIKEIREQCTEDCERLNQEYFQSRRGGFGKASCTCVDDENKPIQIW